jgi:hypothetical protein
VDIRGRQQRIFLGRQVNAKSQREKSTRIADKEPEMTSREQEKRRNLPIGVVTIGLLLWFVAISLGLGFVTTHFRLGRGASMAGSIERKRVHDWFSPNRLTSAGAGHA